MLVLGGDRRGALLKDAFWSIMIALLYFRRTATTHFMNGIMATMLEWSLIARLGAGGAIGALLGSCFLAVVPLLWDAGREKPTSSPGVWAPRILP